MCDANPVKTEIVRWSFDPKLIQHEDNSVSLTISGTIADGWHVYANPKGPGTGLPLTITLTEVPEAEILYPEGERFDIPDLDEWVLAYHNYFEVTISLPPSAAKKMNHMTELTVMIRGLVCKEACVPIQTVLMIPLGELAPVTSGSLSANGLDSPPAAQVNGRVQSGLPLMLIYMGLGILAGFVLNFMPCVLPVLSLKVLSVLSLGKSRALSAAIFYSLGVLTVFTILAALMAFAGLLWGQQFQEPRFLIGLGVVVIFFILSLFDLFQFNLFSGSAGRLSDTSGQEGIWHDYIKGVVATLLATPCSGPFLGGTLSWASQQTPMVIFVVYLCVGVGMALPFFLIVLIPGLKNKMPKPGPWMVKIREGSAFIMMATLAYLLSILSPQLRMPVLFYFLGVTFLGWLYASFQKYSVRVVSFLILAAISVPVFKPSFTVSDANAKASENQAMQFSPDTVEKLRNQGKTVIVDFTADWCPNCKVVEKLVLHAEDVVQYLEQNEVVLLIADLTLKNKVAEDELNRLGGRSIPFLAFYPSDTSGEVLTLRDVYTKDMFYKKLNQVLQDKVVLS